MREADQRFEGGPEGSSELRAVLASGLVEELRAAEREKWRATVQVQGALDHLQFYEQKSSLLEAELAKVTTQASALDRRVRELDGEASRLKRELDGILGSRAWKAIVRFRRLKGVLRSSRR